MDQRVFPSLGILKVGAVLERAGHQVDHLDLSGVSNYLEVLTQYRGATTFAITATSPQMPAAMEIGWLLRAGGMKTILGGPHPTLTLAAAKFQHARAKKAIAVLMKSFDVVVSGDGEESIFQALDSNAGCINGDDPKSPLWITSQAFSESPWPARHLIDVASYNYHIDGERAQTLVSQLGCPFGCKFCAGRNSSMLRRIRTRPAESVVAELLHIYDTYGTKGFMFYDDELNVNKSIVDLMLQIKAAGDSRGIEWRLRGFLKSELFTEEQAEAMYAAGFRQILVGFEAADPRILENIEKRATVEDNTRAVEIAHKHGLKVKALMSIGHAGESESSVLAVRDWLLKVKPSDFDVTVITPYPGSPYYDQAVEGEGGAWCYTAKNGDLLFMDDVDFTEESAHYKGMPGEYVSHVWTLGLSRERIVELRDQVERKVRTALGIPFYATGGAVAFEASMGQTKLPRQILRSVI